MLRGDPVQVGRHVMTVCNACRYCEQYCAVFPAMELRRAFSEADLNYLANLCHNCGECLYACQYAPPHEFAINVPRTLAELRVRSYEQYCWPRFLGRGFRSRGVATSLALVVAFAVVMLVLTARLNPGALTRTDASADFYGVVPHNVMVLLFGGVAIFVLAALGIAWHRFWRDLGGVGGGSDPMSRSVSGGLTPVRDILTLRYLHGSGVDCTTAEETRRPWRRWMHHCTFYGFMLCFASTSVAAVYHFLGSVAPYGYTSLPVVLGTVGGLGLVVGPAGLLALRRRRDPALGDPSQQGMDVSFLLLLLLTSATGLALLALRHSAVMATMLVVHLGTVLALFVTLPYGKFVHALYRTAALMKFAAEVKNDR